MKSNHIVYPSVNQSWGILLTVIISMFVFAPVNIALNNILGKEISFLIYYLLAMGVPLLLAHAARKKRTTYTTYNLTAGSLKISLLITLAAIGIQTGLTMPIGSSIPMPESIQELFLEFANMNGFYAFLAIVIAAPVLEEMLFRGIILDGLLQKYSPVKSIVLSSILFGIAHLNPWQFVSALIIGFFSGWIYYRTRKLTFPILIHIVNNGFSFLILSFSDAEKMLNKPLDEYYGNSMNLYLVVIGALLLATFCILLLKKEFSVFKINWSDPPSSDSPLT